MRTLRHTPVARRRGVAKGTKWLVGIIVLVLLGAAFLGSASLLQLLSGKSPSSQQTGNSSSAASTAVTNLASASSNATAGPPGLTGLVVHLPPPVNFTYNQNQTTIVYGSPPLSKPAAPAVANSGKPTEGVSLGPPPTGASGDGFCSYSDGSCVNLSRSGGPVMNNPKILIDFWVGPSCGGGQCFEPTSTDPSSLHVSDTQYEQLVYVFLSGLCSTGASGQMSPLMQIVQQYTGATNGHGGSVPMGNCSLLTPDGHGYLVDTGNANYNNNPLHDSDIQDEAVAAMQLFGYSPDDNTIVLVYTPAGTGVSSGCNVLGQNCQLDCNFSPNNCGNYCAYHGSFGSGTLGDGPKYIYAILPDQVAPSCNQWTNGGSPNSPIADSAVDKTYHELMESFTNPQHAGCCTGTYGWSDPGSGQASGGEIGDLCSYDYNGAQPSNSADVQLGPYSFEIQTIWSNSNNGCVHDLAGTEVSVQETLQPHASAGIPTPVPAGEPPFTITFQMPGESSPGTTITLPPQATGATVTTYFVTPNTSVSTTPAGYPATSTSNSGACFDMGCNGQTTFIGPAPVISGPSFGGPNISFTFVYYQLLWEGPYLNLFTCTPGAPACVGAPPAPSVDFTYVTVPTKASSTDSLQTLSVPLGTAPTGTGTFVLDGSQASVPYCTPTSTAGVNIRTTICGAAFGAATQTWATGGAPCLLPRLGIGVGSTCYAASTSAPITNINYYDQYLFTASYSVSDGGNPTVTLSATQFGKPVTITLTSAPTAYWLDAYTGWSVPNAAFSGTTERWLTSPTVEPLSGMVAPSRNLNCLACTSTSTTSKPTTYATLSIAPQYAHQYLLTLVSSPQNGGKFTPSFPPQSNAWEPAGATVTISVMPNAGYTFTGWTGAPGCSAVSTCTVTMSAPIVAVANFH